MFLDSDVVTVLFCKPIVCTCRAYGGLFEFYLNSCMSVIFGLMRSS